VFSAESADRDRWWNRLEPLARVPIPIIEPVVTGLAEAASLRASVRMLAVPGETTATAAPKRATGENALARDSNRSVEGGLVTLSTQSLRVMTPILMTDRALIPAPDNVSAQASPPLRVVVPAHPKRFRRLPAKAFG
jgi:hypothetical protein